MGKMNFVCFLTDIFKRNINKTLPKNIWSITRFSIIFLSIFPNCLIQNWCQNRYHYMLPKNKKVSVIILVLLSVLRSLLLIKSFPIISKLTIIIWNFYFCFNFHCLSFFAFSIAVFNFSKSFNKSCNLAFPFRGLLF